MKKQNIIKIVPEYTKNKREEEKFHLKTKI